MLFRSVSQSRYWPPLTLLMSAFALLIPPASFTMLDDAAYFAVNSQITDSFVYTTSFHIQILRPVKTGIIKAIGTVQFVSRNLFIGDAILYDSKGREVARGTGNFMKSGLALDESLGYR